MFVRADLVQVGLSTFQWMPYALGLVCFDAEPATIVDSILQALRRNIEQMTRDAAEEHLQLPPGTPLTVNRGPFAGYKAIFDTRLPGSDRIRILLNVARGTQVPVELAAAYVEKAA
jgi:transcriptional antiterminator RfaH